MYRIVSTLLLCLLAACTVPNTELRDQPQVERLRIQISKARNAITETRRAIAEARGAPYVTELYVRLAELLGDEARYHYQVAYEREQRSGKSLHVPQVRFLKEQALGIYNQVLETAPQSPLVPRVLFNMGQEHRELGNYDKMRAVLERLVANHQGTPLRQEALLILGDDRFDRSELKEAGKYYGMMLEGGFNRMTGLGHYKYAWVQVNEANCKKALKHFREAILASEKWFGAGGQSTAEPGTQSNLDVRREALVDLVYCYTQEHKDKNAIKFLKGLAYSRGAYVAALERLADRLGTLDAAAGALLAGRELLVLGADSDKRIEDGRMLYAAIQKTKNFNKVGSDAGLIARAFLRQIRRPTGAAETRERLESELETMIANLGILAQKSLNKLPKKSDARLRLARQISQAYELHVRTFPDSTQRPSILANLVDVQVAAGMNFDAGRSAVELAEVLKTGNERDNAWYDALVNFQAALKGTSTRMQRVVARAGLRKAGKALLARSIQPDRARRVKFAVAQSDYDEGRYRVAIDRLNAVAFEYPATPEGNTAVNLVLDSYKTANDYLGLIRAGHRFMAKTSPIQSSIKAEIAPIVKSAEQFQLDELALAAAGVDGGDVTGDLEKFASAYEGTALGERAVINALLAARAAGDSKTLYRLASEFETKYPKSAQLSAIRSTVARAAASRYEFDQAVKYFEKAARAPGAQRVQLYVAAGQLKEQLGDIDGARDTFKAALKASDSSAARSLAVLPLVKLLERNGQHKTIVSTVAPLGDDASPETLAYLGIAQIQSGQPDEGEATLQRVLDGGTTVSTEARARAHFGQAEVFLKALESFEPGEDLETIQELVTLLEVTEQAYLKAAREGDPSYTAAAFARLAVVSSATANRMKTIKIPTGTDPQMAKALKQGFAQRAVILEKQAKEALLGCAEQGWIHYNFNPLVRECLAGKLPKSAAVSFDKLKPRKAATDNENLESLRVRLSKNAEDLDALRAIGESLLSSRDYHAARLAFARAGQIGGGPIEANLLGIASLRAGDTTGALDAFARAAAGGLTVGKSNLISTFKTLGMTAAAQEAAKRYTGGQSGGMPLNKAK